jgi:hypothetical protein
MCACREEEVHLRCHLQGQRLNVFAGLEEKFNYHHSELSHPFSCSLQVGNVLAEVPETRNQNDRHCCWIIVIILAAGGIVREDQK